MANVRGKKARGFFDYEFRKDEIKSQQASLEKLNKVHTGGQNFYNFERLRFSPFFKLKTLCL